MSTPITAAEIDFGGALQAPEETPAQPASPSWPQPLGPAAYHGVLGDAVRIIEPESEADPAAVLLHLLVMFGNLIGRAAHFTVGADTHYLNLFVGIVGRTAKGRKGMSRSEAQRVFEGVDPEWALRCLTSGFASGEGAIWAVRDPIEKTVAVRQNGRVVDYETVIEDHGVSDKRITFIESELASTLKVMARDGNTLSQVIRQAWDGQKLNIKTKNSPATATGAHVSVVGHISKDELLRYLQSTEVAGGTGNRFLWVVVQRSKSLPDGGRPVFLDGVIARLRDAANNLKDRHVELRRDDEARELWHRVYPQLGADIPGLLGAVTGRAEAQVMRLACLYALADLSFTVRRCHLLAALEVWRYSFSSARYIFGSTLGDPNADKLLRELKLRAPKRLSRDEICHDVFSGHLPAAEINRVCHLLANIGAAACDRERDGAGRPTEWWWYRAEPYAGCDISDVATYVPPVDDEAGGLSRKVAYVAPQTAHGGPGVEEVEI